MKPIPLKAALLVIAVLAAWLAAIKPHAFGPRPDRAFSLVKVDPTAAELYSTKPGVAPGASIARALAVIGSRDAIARAVADPLVASLPGLKGLPDPAAAEAVAAHLTVRVRPGTRLVEVRSNWPSGFGAAAIVNAVVDDAVAAAPDELSQINRALAGPATRRSVRIVPCALITLAAALAILLLLAGPGLLNKVRATACPTCGRWGFRRVRPAA